MRKLTLNEKITIRGILERKNVTTSPKFDMCQALFLFPIIFGCSVGEYATISYAKLGRI